MGLMRFNVSPPDRITEDVLQQAYLSGLDRIPWEVRTRRGNDELWLERASSDSGNLHVPWTVEGHGRMLLATGTLRECAKQYQLPLELARGKLAQVRNQLGEWKHVGLDVPAAIPPVLAEAVRAFGEAAVSSPGSPRSVELAERVLKLAMDAGVAVTAAYAEQALGVRRRMAGGKLATLLGGGLGDSPLDESIAPQFVQAFNAALVPMTWGEVETGEEEFNWDVCDRQIQWCREQGLAVCAGPLLQLDHHSVPSWLHVCDDDFDAVLTFASEFVEAAVRRYKGQVNVWLCAGGANTAEVLSLSEEDVVQLAAQAVQITRSIDSAARVFLAIDQPWAEYLTHQEKDFSPIHFADALLRANLGLSGVALEINFGYFPGGTLPRDSLEVSQHLDFWSMLGVPLMLSVSAPSGTQPDPLAHCQTGSLLGDWSPASQQAWVQRYVSLMLAKPAVQGVLWHQLRDAEPHEFAHGGLFDLRRQAKPALRALAALRQAHLR